MPSQQYGLGCGQGRLYYNKKVCQTQILKRSFPEEYLLATQTRAEGMVWEEVVVE